jgi:hypothetical protein
VLGRGLEGRRPEEAGRMDCRGGDTMATMLRGEERTARGGALGWGAFDKKDGRRRPCGWFFSNGSHISLQPYLDPTFSSEFA